MKFLSLEPFVPSGNDFEGSKQLFQELGFTIAWDAGDYVGFEKDGCKFALQKFDNKAFAENFMLTIKVSDVQGFWKDVTDRQLSKRFNIKIGKPTKQPYGMEVNVIDIAGVCWHFVE